MLSCHTYATQMIKTTFKFFEIGQTAIVNTGIISSLIQRREQLRCCYSVFFTWLFVLPLLFYTHCIKYLDKVRNLNRIIQEIFSYVTGNSNTAFPAFPARVFMAHLC